MTNVKELYSNSNKSYYNIHPSRSRAISLFAIAVITFSITLSIGVMGLVKGSYPLWLQSTLNTLGKKGAICVLVGGYSGSAALAEYAGPIHSKALCEHEKTVNPQTAWGKMFETATRVPRVIISTAIEVACLPLAGVLLLIACCKSNYDSAHPKQGIPILQIHGSGFNEIEWVASWPYLNKYGPVFTLNLDGLVSNEHEKGIDDYAQEKVRAKIKAISASTGHSEIILMGHSMGGLVASYYAENCAQDDGITIKHVMTIATPWQGAPILNNYNEESKPKRYKQMSENSQELASLRAQALASETRGVRSYYSIATTNDGMVPGISGILTTNRARNTVYSVMGHYGIIVYPKTWLQIRSWLDPIYSSPASM